MDRHYLSRCPACGSANVSKKFTAVDYTATGETFDVFECAACGMRFTQNAPIEQNAGKYYHSPDYISHSDTRKGIVNRIYHYVRSVMLRRKAKLVADVLGKTEGKLLDIGAGTGYFANEMKRAGFYVNAVEIDSGARKFALEHFGVTEEDISALDKFPDENFDAFTMWHVMEHVYRLSEEWQKLHRLLKNNGRLIIAVPNCASADANHYKEMWAAYDVPRHLWHFNPHTMRLVAQQHGFKLVATHPMPFDGFYISMLSEKNKGASFPFVRGLWQGFKALSKASCNKEKSSSVIYVFEKLS